MNYYRRHIGDYLRDTAHLTLLEHGVYTRLLDIYYTRESSIPVDQAARLIGARTKDEKEAVERVLEEFFVLIDGTWIQARCEREIDSMQSKAERNRAIGKKGGRPRKIETQEEPRNNPDGFQPEPKDNPSHKPIANSQEKERETRTRKTPDSLIPDDFGVSELVKVWAKKNGHQGLERHLEAFRLKCRAKAYRYADWDSAFMEAIRKDWAGIGNPQSSSQPAWAGAK